jgi:hypothetical protein
MGHKRTRDEVAPRPLYPRKRTLVHARRGFNLGQKSPNRFSRTGRGFAVGRTARPRHDASYGLAARISGPDVAPPSHSSSAETLSRADRRPCIAAAIRSPAPRRRSIDRRRRRPPSGGSSCSGSTPRSCARRSRACFRASWTSKRGAFGEFRVAGEDSRPANVGGRPLLLH